MKPTQLPLARSEVLDLQPDVHGGPDHGELQSLGRVVGDVLDFSASTNAFGPPPAVIEAIMHCDVTRYPDRLGEPLRSCLAAHEGVASAQVLLANGAAQLIWSVAMAYLRPGDAVVVSGPTFGEYRVASALMGAQVNQVRADADQEFRPDLTGLSAAVKSIRPRVAWLCNPNNPTGAYLPESVVQELVSVSPGTLWVIDEAYRPFVAQPWDPRALLPAGNVVLLRSFTKDYALPGLRLGYALASEPIIEALARVQPPWSASAPAIAAGLAALGERDHVTRTLELLRAEATRLRATLAGQGWRTPESATHFFLVQAGNATEVRARLLRGYNIQVRDCSSFGLPDFIRIATRTPGENDRLGRAMQELQ